MGNLIEQVKDVEIVGCIFDEKMTMEKMLKHVSKKAKTKLGAIRRLSHHPDSGNLEVICTKLLSVLPSNMGTWNTCLQLQLT